MASYAFHRMFGPHLTESDFMRLLKHVEPRANSCEPESMRSISNQSRHFLRFFLKNIFRKAICAAEARTCELEKLVSNKLKTLTEKEKELVCNCVCHFDTYISVVLHLIQFPGYKEQQ